MERDDLKRRFLETRKTSEEICAPLEVEDYVVQPIDDVSPPKWHLGHTTWFFETFLLKQFRSGYIPHNDLYGYLFNSYYESIGERWDRPRRGVLSRPTVKDVYKYRASIDPQMVELIGSVENSRRPNFAFLVDLGIHHEQQHQELLYTDIKNILAGSPLHPAYREISPKKSAVVFLPASYKEFEGGIVEIGYEGSGFAFDNEMPRHQVLLRDFRLQNRLVTNREYLEFMKDGGYADARLWLSDGWQTVQERGWQSPLYWENVDDRWHVMTLTGFRAVEPEEPVCHVSFYEADAFARWTEKRLPTEEEWEHAAVRSGAEPSSGNFVDDKNYHPVPLASAKTDALQQMFGDVWEWTASAYLPYPGFRPAAGAIGEYNGKFMSNQMVLRGGACVTPRNHIRPTYRNFFQCDKRWQFSGIRLASDP